MIKSVLIEAGVAPLDFSIVPFPIHQPELYRYYLPLGGTFFLTIYDDWGRRKLDLFQSMELSTEVLWERTLSQKGISATDVRRRMGSGETWHHLVPAATRRLMDAWGIPERLRKTFLMKVE